MIAWTTTITTAGSSCPNCGYHISNCGGHNQTYTATTWLRNWQDEDEEVVDEHHRHLITANWYRPERPSAVLLPLIRLWPQARAPPAVSPF